MVTVEKGKMDEAVVQGKCHADFSDYTPVMTTHYIEMVDLGVSPADLTQTYDDLNTALDRAQASTKTTTEAIVRHSKTLADSVVAAPHRISAQCPALGGFSGNGVIVRLPKYVKRHVYGTYTARIRAVTRERNGHIAVLCAKRNGCSPSKSGILYDIDHAIGQNLESDKKNPAKFCRSKVTEDRLQILALTLQKNKRQKANGKKRAYSMYSTACKYYYY
jgi:hypothetical protein